MNEKKNVHAENRKNGILTVDALNAQEKAMMYGSRCESALILSSIIGLFFSTWFA
tara:strand:- start:659 stop:823 length:165 start_codon:yes stop_codon:yes gene_type:complete